MSQDSAQCGEIKENLENTEVTVENAFPDVNENTDQGGSTEIIEALKNKIYNHEKTLEEYALLLKGLEAKCSQSEEVRKELEEKYETALKQKELATKEKESMVVRYAVGEKSVLKEREQKEVFEKKYKEQLKENEILQHKLQTMVTEKARICQLLDNKCYECKSAQQELEKVKVDLNNLETKLKWSQNSLKTEIESHREAQVQLENVSKQLQQARNEIEQVKKEAQDSIKAFQYSQENRAHVLDQQVQEQQASLILLKHERNDRDQQLKNLQEELNRLHTKQNEMLQENNELSIKVQQLETERLEIEQKLRELRSCADQNRQNSADLQSKTSQLEQIKLQLANEQEQQKANNEQIKLLKERNSELESDMEACRTREAELLLFTQQLTEKNVRLQSEFTAMETKVQQLNCEQALLKRSIKEQETKAGMLSAKLSEERVKFTDEISQLSKELSEACREMSKFKQEATDQKGENQVIKRKYELTFRELNKELQQCMKKLETYECSSTTSNSSSSSSLNVDKSQEEQVKIVQPAAVVDRQALIEHIVKLQRISAKKSEKIDFLEEHVNTLVTELQKKSKLLQSYVLREQSGTMTSNTMDNNKAKLAKLNGVMASLYSSRVVDQNLTLELSLDINRKLQAVLEDTLLKNITLKENVDTLGAEIDRLRNAR